MIRRVWKFLPLSALGLLTTALAQDLDTFTFHSERKPFTVLDRIEDREEKEAFQQLLGTVEAAEKKRLAESFWLGTRALGCFRRLMRSPRKLL